ncbi:hypothetical protein [Glaciecola sp. 1036]|uniref:hypothetical protein n=1 Tax=Alteromonadaceae TaxID=72275 RepID=UPI003CFCFCAB
MKIINRSTSINQPAPIRSDPSRWNLIPHKVTTETGQLWVGTLDANQYKPLLSRVVIFKDNEQVQSIDIVRVQWEKPIENLSNRFFTLLTIEGLSPNTKYTAVFYRQIEHEASEFVGDWLQLKTAYFTTLPLSLPTEENTAFTLSLSSCFYAHKDDGNTANAFKALYHNGTQAVQPDIKFMVGDQVYLDIGIDSLSPLTNEVRCRIADDYQEHWKVLDNMLRRGGTWMLPDDHEYWNDYPFYDGFIPTLFMLRIAKIRRAWKKASKNGVENIQQTTKPLEFFKIGDDISFCIADLRSTRSKTQFINKENFSKMIEWAKNLTTPGVLVIPQILIVEENKTERNLLSFKSQYTKLINALADAKRDIVVLSGDVHFGRISSVKIGNHGKKLIEVVASPTSNLTGVNSVATAKPKYDPEYFPDRKARINCSWEPEKVEYPEEPFRVGTQNGRWFSTYWRPRTKEHFMTIGFRKDGETVKMQVQAWLVRQLDNKGMPKPQFETPYEFTLNK